MFNTYCFSTRIEDTLISYISEKNKSRGRSELNSLFDAVDLPYCSFPSLKINLRDIVVTVNNY